MRSEQKAADILKKQVHDKEPKKKKKKKHLRMKTRIAIRSNGPQKQVHAKGKVTLPAESHSQDVDSEWDRNRRRVHYSRLQAALQ